MEIHLALELENDSKNFAYCLPVSHWPLPGGAPVPVKGDVLTMMVFEFKRDPAWLEPRRFEVAERSIYMHYDRDKRDLQRLEITLWLKDLGSAMTNDAGLGALGTNDPVLKRSV